MVTVTRRVAGRTGIDCFHWHMLRHSFAVNYLVNGRDAFSLRQAPAPPLLADGRHAGWTAAEGVYALEASRLTESAET